MGDEGNDNTPPCEAVGYSGSCEGKFDRCFASCSTEGAYMFWKKPAAGVCTLVCSVAHEGCAK